MRTNYAVVVTGVQVVESFVLIYIRVDDDEPSVLMYSEPLTAEIVGAPEP